MTKREMFNTIKEIAEVKANEEMVKFINHEIELLDKKSSKSAPTKTQKEAQESEQVEKDITTYSLADDMNGLPDWAKAVRATEEKMNI